MLLQEAVAPEDRIVRAKLVIDSKIGGVVLRWRKEYVIVIRSASPHRHPRIVWVGKERREFHPNRVQAAWRNNSGGGRDASCLSRGYAVQWISSAAQLAEITGLHIGRWHHRGLRHILLASKTLVVTKEKGMVAVDGTADSATKLILTKGPFGDALLSIEISIRIEHAVPGKQKGVAMKLVCSALDRGIDDGAGRGAELR